MGKGQNDGSLADASGPDHRDKPVRQQLVAERFYNLFAPHQPTRARGQPKRRGLGLRRRRIRRGPNRGDETVALPGDVGDVTAFPQRLAKGGDVEAEAALIGDGAGPDLTEQFRLGDNLAWAFQQHLEDIEGLAPERYGRSVTLQAPAAGQKPEWSEHDAVGRIGKVGADEHLLLAVSAHSRFTPFGAVVFRPARARTPQRVLQPVSLAKSPQAQ